MNNEIEAIKAIKVELDKIKESGSLSDFFSILKEGLLPSGKIIKKEHRYMAFLLCIDAISQKLYSKDSENGYYAIELSKYTNGETACFDLLFKHASLLICDLIFEEMSPEKDVKFKDYKMNVILKMDTHNNPQGKSKYSLITHAGDFFITDENCNSLAYTLFFDYSLFCNSKKDNKELTDDEIYTVHKEFINEKTARSFAYQFEESNLIKYIDGNKEVETNYDLNKGEKHYKDFISYILNEELIEKDDSDFSRYLRDSNTDNSWKKGKSLSSFSYYNLGIPGFESWGTLMIECNKDVQTVYEKFYRRGGENDDTLLLSQIKNVISALKKIDDEYNDALNKQRIRRESEKSAKAAIMSRNMSHNIGSHVMSYLKQHLGSVKDIVADGILSDLINSENELAKKLENTTENTTLPFLMGLGHFISYLQERQDFIATIATDYIPYFGNVNFKDSIYDNLNPDKRAERHTERLNGKTDNILLGNIARSEGLGRTNQSTSKKSGKLSDIVLIFRDSDGNIFDGNPVVNKDNDILPGREGAYKALEAMRKLELSLPGGVIGRQAVFSVVENIVRNAAKHGKWRDKGQLELTFEFFDKDSIPVELAELKKQEAPLIKRIIELKKKEEEDKLTVTELDEYNHAISECNNIKKALEPWTQDAAPITAPHGWFGRDKHLSLLEVFWHFYTQSEFADDLYFLTITDNVPIAESSVKKLREALIEDYIDEESKMKEGNKGIKEIRISSAWLRGAKNEEDYYNSGVDLEGGQQTKKKAPLVYVRQHNGCLQYIICLQKPRKLAVVTNETISKETIKALKENNGRYYSPSDYKNERNKSFDFILYDDRYEQKDKELSYDALKQISSSRFWRLLDINELTEKINGEKIMLYSKIEEKTEEGIKDILSVLYKKLSHYEEGDNIWIDDKTATANVKRDTEGNNPRYKKSNQITVLPGITEEGDYAYIYRTHHDTDEQYHNFIDSVTKGIIKNNLFVEGITGNNSTDRLIRNEQLDNIWFYKHLHAMKEQIAIFDERLFTKIFGLEETHLKEEKFTINESNRESYRDRYYEDILKGDDENYNLFLDKSLQDQDAILTDAFKNKDNPATSKEKEYAKTVFKPIVYKQKGIYVFTLIQDPYPERQHLFNLYGLSKESDIKKAICTKIATLSWDSTYGLVFRGEILNKENYYINNYKRFDSFSIHQGLLDKLYEVFGIKEQPEEKERLTRQFFKAFSSLAVSVPKPEDKGSEKAEGKVDYHFLPGMCIHSGRSKPSQIDMPQKLPFIQYASIENAVLDCKYSLVELLDFARYE